MLAKAEHGPIVAHCEDCRSACSEEPPDSTQSLHQLQLAEVPDRLRGPRTCAVPPDRTYSKCWSGTRIWRAVDTFNPSGIGISEHSCRQLELGSVRRVVTVTTSSQPAKTSGISSTQQEFGCLADGCDHEVDGAASSGPSAPGDRRVDPSACASCSGVERALLEPGFGSLEPVLSPGPFGRVGGGVRSGGLLRHRDRRHRDLAKQTGRFETSRSITADVSRMPRPSCWSGSWIDSGVGHGGEIDPKWVAFGGWSEMEQTGDRVGGDEPLAPQRAQLADRFAGAVTIDASPASSRRMMSPFELRSSRWVMVVITPSVSQGVLQMDAVHSARLS